MTIKKLHSLLGKAMMGGYSHYSVSINKDTFKHPLEPDGACIMDVEDCHIQTYGMLDENGSFKELKDGTESQRTSFVLLGEKRRK